MHMRIAQIEKIKLCI